MVVAHALNFSKILKRQVSAVVINNNFEYIKRAMQQVFFIEGMTCGNCVKSVRQKLSSLDDVSQVEVDLDSGKAKLTTKKRLDKTVLKQALGSKYAILDQEYSQTKTKVKSLFPLFLILTYIVMGAVYLSVNQFSPSRFMFHYMGLFFVVFSFFKFLDYSAFPTSFANYDPIAKRSMTYGYLYPFIETLLGIAFLLQWQLQWALWITMILLSITSVGVIQSLINKRQIECACLGTVLKLPMTEATLIENSVMIVMSVSMLLSGIH